MSQPPPPPNNISGQGSSTGGGTGSGNSSTGGQIVAFAQRLASLEASTNPSGSSSFASRYSRILNGPSSANTNAALASFPSAASRLVAIAPSLNALSSPANSGPSYVQPAASASPAASVGANFPEMTLEDLSQNVTIMVGGGVAMKVFFLPECIVIRHSPVMKTALKDAWQQGEKKEVVLKEEDPEHFAAFLSWIYTGDVDSSATVPKATGEDDEVKLLETQNRFQYLLDCYVLANFLQADGYKNAIIDKILHDYKTAPGDGGRDLFCSDTYLISKLYQNTSPKDPLRKFLVDLYLWECGPETFSEGMAMLSDDVHFREFGFELLGAAWIASKESHNLLLHAQGIPWSANLRPPTGPPGYKGNCRYHVHSDAEEGYNCDQK